jgi:hypothetical protein
MNGPGALSGRSLQEDEFFALTMACRMNLVIYPGPSEESFIGQMGKKFLAQICEKGLGGSRQSIMARMRRVPAPGLDASCNPRAIERSGCTPAEPYPPNRFERISPLEPKCTRESLEKCNRCAREKLLPMYRNFHIEDGLPKTFYFSAARRMIKSTCSRPVTAAP